eukprot:s4526_g6.t1
MLERVLQQSQQQLYSELLALLERQTSADLQRNGLSGLRDAASPMPQLGAAPNCRQLDRLHDITAENAKAIGMVPNAADSSPEHTVSGRRSLTYELAIKASAPSEADADKLASKSMSLTDVLTTEVGAPQGRVGKLVSSWQFEAFFAAVILTNSIFIGVVIQWESENSFAGPPDSIYAISIGYGILFTVELLFRMIAAGPWSFYCKANWAWNVFDTLIVASVLYEFLVDTRGQSTSMSSNLRVLRVVRLTRLTRIVRVFRVARFLRPLRTLVQSILGTLRALIWAMLLMTLINYVFAAIFTDVVGNYMSDTSQLESRDALVPLFGTLQSSSLTLFMSISGGLSWFDAVHPLKRIGWLWVYVYCVYIAFCLFALLNVMTGVFCNAAIRGAERDAEMAVQTLMMDKQRLDCLLGKLFQKMDSDGTGKLDITKFEAYYRDDEVRAVFEALDLGAHDAWTFFQSLDNNEDHQIEAGEFLDGCARMRGPAKAVDLFALRTQTAKIRKELEVVVTNQQKLVELIAQERLHSRSGSSPNSFTTKLRL